LVQTAEEFELHKQATIADYNESLPSLDAPTTEVWGVARCCSSWTTRSERR
jgi:hypothetical protein